MKSTKAGVVQSHNSPSNLGTAVGVRGTDATKICDAANSDSLIDALDDGKASVEALLAQELTAMNLTEREHAYEELHGVDQVRGETPEFITQKLQELEVAIHALILDQNGSSSRGGGNASSQAAAYVRALQVGASYVKSAKFRLMFLRADYFDPVEAARRLLRFVHDKLQYFGPQSLGRPLNLSDLHAEDIPTLDSGYMQYLPIRDRAGRIVFCDFHTMYRKTYDRPENLMRSFIYLIMSVVENDEETQKRGMVGIFYQMGRMGHEPDVELFQHAPNSLHWLPVRFSGCHMCINDPIVCALVHMALRLAGRNFRARYRLHEGSGTECQYSLMTFGIPVKSFPVSNDGEVNNINHKKWLLRRKSMEMTILLQQQQQQQQQQQFLYQVQQIQQMQNLLTPPQPLQRQDQQQQQQQLQEHLRLRGQRPDQGQQIADGSAQPSASASTTMRSDSLAMVAIRIEWPSANDVLVGKGLPFQQHAGNVRLRTLVGMKMKEYKSARKGVKTKITKQLVQTIKSTSGRFLKRDSDGWWWTEISDFDAREKVSKTFTSAAAAASSGAGGRSFSTGSQTNTNTTSVFLEGGRKGNNKRAKVTSCFASCA